MQTVIPINYNLEFETDLRNFTFSGREVIEIKCQKSTNNITLDAAELKIKKCYLLHGKIPISAKTKLDGKKEELQIKLNKKIKGKATLFIDYTGILNDRLLGFYRSQYKDKNGKTQYLATTQFEAADARRAFPCWDVPNSKATYEISIIADKKYSAISNMPIESKTKLGAKNHYKFKKTPIMPTYLIYLGVGDFEYIKSKIGKIEVRVITTRGNISKGKYALDLGKKLLREYENYFGIKYPLPKLDLIAIPDFAAGAMENWGAITFRETILLYDPKTSSTRTKQYIAEVISHEIAHQWFGNLVTMEWWNDLWLNESFATYMATKFVDKFYPKWDLWDQFLEDAMNVAMGLDSLKSSHPIDVKVNHPSEIREIFDAISYDKGGCVLRMLENYVGEKNFRNGLKKYLKKHMYANAEGKDLWDAIGKISKMPVRSLMDTWVKQQGFPFVDVKKKNSTLLIKQHRFLLDHDKNKKDVWPIPIYLRTKKSINKKLIIKKTDSMKIGAGNSSLVVNSGRSGFYRVNYDDELLTDLQKSISEKTISHVDRWAIQNDLYAFCISGQNTVKNYLELSDAYVDEDDYLVSVNVANNLYSLYNRCRDEPFSNVIKQHALHYFSNVHQRLGWNPKKGEKHTDSLLRSFAIVALGKLGNLEIIQEAEKRFEQFLRKPDSLSPDLREPVYTLVAYNGNSSTFKKFVECYKKSKTQEEKLRFLGALCSFKDQKLLLKTLEFSQTPNVRSQNMQLPIMRIAANHHGKKILWPWLKKNWKNLAKKVGYGNPLLNRIVSSISLIADQSMEKEIKDFFRKNPTPGTERTLEQTLERIRISSKFLKRMRIEFQ